MRRHGGVGVLDIGYARDDAHRVRRARPLAGSGLLQVRIDQTHLPARSGVGIHLAHRLWPRLGSGPSTRTDPWVRTGPRSAVLYLNHLRRCDHGKAIGVHLTGSHVGPGNVMGGHPSVPECIGYERGVSLCGPVSDAIALGCPGQGLMGTPVRAGRSRDGLRVRECIRPPLRPTRLRCERGSVGVVLPSGSHAAFWRTCDANHWT